MKKFVVIIAIFIICIFTYNDLVFKKGIYRNISDIDSLKVNFTINDKEIRLNNNNFIIKGVILNSNIPNSNKKQYKASKNDYLRWINEIYEMGANTIRLVEVIDSDFYNALYEFNSNKENPIYIIQGITVTDYINNNSKDAYDEEYIKILSERSKIAIDVIHGRKNIILNNGYGLGIYRNDVSEYLIGYLIGEEWNSYTIAYTNNEEEVSFKGIYFETTEEANAFECLLAKQMDEIITYETKKYNKQSLISYSSSSNTDPFKYDDYYAAQLSKIVSLDSENIKTTEKLKSGFFNSYRLEEFIDNYYEYFSEEQKLKLKTQIINYEEIKLDYLTLISTYHSNPVIVSSYGYSTARGIESKKVGPYTEEEQGKILVDKYKEIIYSGCKGAIINSWKDNWSSRTWNTNYSINLNSTDIWLNTQSINTGYGIMAYDLEDENHYIDGENMEWDKKDIVSSNNNIKLSIKTNAKYIYFMVEGITKEDNLIIPIDITPKSGSLMYKEKNCEFNRSVDFIIDINGEYDSKVLVQDYYDSLRENYLKNINGEDPFVNKPTKDSSHFEVIKGILKKDKILNKNSIKYDVNGVPIYEPVYNETYDIGKLNYGNNNINSKDYNSLGDFYYGDNFVEVKVPWYLLNFYNPSKGEVHDDYYENYGIKPLKIRNIYVGIGLPNENISLDKYKLNYWREVKVKERLKRSYEIIKEYWKEV